jgi:hypothetical protein
VPRIEVTSVRCASNSYPLPDNEIAARSQLDTDADGHISLQEYIAWLRNLPVHG